MAKSKRGDKPKMETRMDEFASSKFPDGEKKNVFYMPSNKLVGVESTPDVADSVNTSFWDEEGRRVKEYNEKIFDLDPEYAAFVPHKNLLVRAFFKDVIVSEGGILLPPKVEQTVQTQSGIGFLEPEDSPFAFKNLVVVVSVPDGYETYAPGDVLQVSWGLVLPVPKQKNDSNRNVLPHAFTLYTHQELLPPTSIEDKHFGYFLVDPYQGVMGKVTNFKK